MEKIFEHIDAKYNTDFYLNFNSLEPTTVKNESVFGQDWTYTAKSVGTKKHPHYEFDKSKLSAKDEKTFEVVTAVRSVRPYSDFPVWLTTPPSP